jgi:hypothetical protein
VELVLHPYEIFPEQASDFLPSTLDRCTEDFDVPFLNILLQIIVTLSGTGFMPEAVLMFCGNYNKRDEGG